MNGIPFLLALIYVKTTLGQDTNSNSVITPENYATSSTTYELNITVEFDQLSDRKSYDFFGTLFIPLMRIQNKDTLTLRLPKVHCKDGKTFQRTVHLNKIATEGLFPHLFVSFEPDVRSEATDAINIKTIRLNEEIKTVTTDGKNTKIGVATISRVFTPNGFDGTTRYKSQTKFNQFSEMFGSSDSGSETKTTETHSTTGAASGVTLYLPLVALSVLIFFVNKVN